ncbi:acyl-CoA dehydrogenase [Corynebacterium sp. sy017]|uniref:acyl-CoA dehydrogenase family protein n=1 Tax=unclassified Corynebacterium TaxID=2624378 RepID=UPI0011871020|nr:MULTISPECIES: acyl-CoA dehydrogenase family protein [unclassified Corynebacterium]MBP3088620.1 acyl-CoA dehydrogenase [Corynebacterium sp. sy017]TSD91912.1 acyl-CoA dehydrogenase [Corynebacterium sp. SY003]
MSHNLFQKTTDFLGVFDDISEEDAAIWARARSFQDECHAKINDCWDKGEYPLDLVRRLGELDLLTDGLDIEGHQKMSPLAAGLALMEITRIDPSMGTVIAVQAGLAMRSIAMLGSDEQKKEWLDGLAKAEKLGAFGLTEPDHGSDSIALETTAVRDGDEFVLNGKKRWIGNGSVGDVTVIWARTEDGEVSGFVVPQNTPGYKGVTQTGKAALRAIYQAEITLTDCRVPLSAQLPGARSFKDVASVLTATRIGVAWMALGSAVACYEKAREYALERHQFGRPLAKNQIIQQRLTNMLLDLNQMMLVVRKVTECEARGELRAEQASFAKLHNTRAARRIAADARDMLGGVGILLENHVIRHFIDIETMHTYEGTDTIQSLIIGKQLTGMSAYR